MSVKKYVFKNIFVVIVLFVIFLMVPYNHDEWAWGTNEGIENLKNFFQGYNGRYFGDILSLLITRSNLFKAFVMTSSTLGVYLSIKNFYRTQNNTNESRRLISLCTFLLLLLPPTPLFRQIYGWPAAFVNFVPPVTFVVLYFQLFHEYVLYKKKPLHPILSGIFIVLATQFFSESVSIFMSILTLSVLAIERLINKENTLFTVCSAVTSFLGSAIMFINPAYLNAANNTDGYKRLELSIGFIWHKISSQLLPNMILNYKLLLVLFNLGMIILLLKKFGTKGYVNKINLAFIIFYTVYGTFFYGQMTFSFSYDATIINVLSIMYFIFLLRSILTVFSGKKRLFNIVVFLSIPLSAAPLIIAEPIGARSFYLTYCLWIMFTGMIYCQIFQSLSLSDSYYILLKTMIRGIIGAMLIFYFFIFGYMYRVQIQREEIIDQSIKDGNPEITLPLLPNENYTWKTSTEPGIWLERFKDFYGIPKEKIVIFK